MQKNDKLNPEELQSPKLATPPVDPTALEEEEKVMEGVEDVVDTAEKDLDKKTYLKVSPTLYIKAVENKDEDSKLELFKILNPETSLVETRELTDEEKKEIYIQELKDSKIKFHPTKHTTKTVGTSTVVSLIGRERKVKNKETQTNIIINQFGSEYRKKRKHKNKFTKISRKANRR